MHSSSLRLLIPLSLAIISSARVSSASTVPPPGPPPPPIVETTTIKDTVHWTCPPIPTVFISVTQYVSVTDTTTDTTVASIWDTITLPTTIYQTVIATTILTSTQIVIETSTTVSPTTTTEISVQIIPTTATEISVTVSPTTDTETTVEIVPTTATETSIEIVPTTATETSVTVSPTTATETSVTVSPTTATETSVTIIPTTATETSITISLTTETDTSTTVSPTTATATEELLLSTITHRATSVTLCPTRLVNPTYTAQGPYPTDWTWGCPPGWLCKPIKDNCNFEAGLPDQNFLCPPDECIPALPLPYPLPTWDANFYGNSTPATNPGLTVQALDNYFNMNPEDFGLTYEIFVIEETITLTATTIRPPSPTIGARQAQTSVPGACYPWCNNCLLEAQANGKTPALCTPGSAFETSMQQCEECIDVHKSDDSGSFVQIAPQFQQFLDYCDQFSTTVVTTSVTATTTNSAGPTTATLESSSTVVVSSVPSSGPQTSVSTVVATTVTTSLSPATTVATLSSTSYSESTITGDSWSQVTIILPLENNVTTTIYGSDLIGSNLTTGATLVLPIAKAAVPYTTTATGSDIAGVTSGSEASSGAATSGVQPSQFSGGSSSGKGFAENLQWWTVMLGTLIPLLFAVGL